MPESSPTPSAGGVISRAEVAHLARSELAERLVPTPSCGLAGATPRYARRVFEVLREVGGWLRDESY